MTVYKEFTLLCEQYVRVAQRLGELQREAAVWDKAAKKGRTWRSSKPAR